MKTIVLEEPGRFVRTETETPGELASGEARVRVQRVGICGSDLHAFRGRQPFFDYPRILGHELGVEVVETGEDSSGLKAGDRCSVEPYLNCGRCIACRQGKTNCCTRLRVLGVRETIPIPADKLHRSDLLSYDQLALVETLGIGAHAVDRAGLEPGEPALVIGAGPIGLSVVQFAQVAGARVMLMEVNRHRLDFCRTQFHVEDVIDGADDPLADLQERLSGDLPTAVFDATGSSDSMMAAFGYVANGGRLILVGLVQSEIRFQDPEFHRREMTLVSSRNSLGRDLSRIIRLMEEEKVDTRPWITHRANFEDLIEQFPSWLKPDEGVVKAMMSFR